MRVLSIAIVADLPAAMRMIADHVSPWRSRKISINSKSIEESSSVRGDGESGMVIFASNWLKRCKDYRIIRCHLLCKYDAL
jgi:hypothetical protein